MTDITCDLCPKNQGCTNLASIYRILDRHRDKQSGTLQRRIDHYLQRIVSTGYQFPSGTRGCDILTTDGLEDVLLQEGREILDKIDYHSEAL